MILLYYNVFSYVRISETRKNTLRHISGQQPVFFFFFFFLRVHFYAFPLYASDVKRLTSKALQFEKKKKYSIRHRLRLSRLQSSSNRSNSRFFLFPLFYYSYMKAEIASSTRTMVGSRYTACIGKSHRIMQCIRVYYADFMHLLCVGNFHYIRSTDNNG